MARLNDTDKERLRTLLVEMLLDLRWAYSNTTGFNRLEQWTILLNRMENAAKSSGNADEWATRVARSLQIAQLGSSACSTLLELSSFVRERNAWRDMRHLIIRERGLLEALGRRLHEERRDARNAAAAAEEATA